MDNKIHVLPEEPVEGLLNSMAICYDHSFGIPNFNETNEEHKERQRRILVLMRKFYDEIAGYGYYKYKENPNQKKILSAHDFKNLERFDETCSDNEGYDVEKEDMKRLAKIGVVQFEGRGFYSITSFGQFVLDVENISSAPSSLECDEDAWNRFQEIIKSATKKE